VPRWTRWWTSTVHTSLPGVDHTWVGMAMGLAGLVAKRGNEGDQGALGGGGVGEGVHGRGEGLGRVDNLAVLQGSRGRPFRRWRGQRRKRPRRGVVARRQRGWWEGFERVEGLRRE
jgi:hypothetical protein